MIADPNASAIAGPATQQVHADRLAGDVHGAVRLPAQPAVQYGCERIEDLIAIFQGNAKGFVYGRQDSPTVAALEARITQMEGGGAGTLCFATGMAAICAVFLTLLKAGDHLVCSQHVFGNTASVLTTLQGFGVEVSLVDATDVANVQVALRAQTRMVFVETLANPGGQIPDMAAIGALCAQRGIVYVVDNTITSPAAFQPRMVQASLVVHSLTKTIAGHGVALGGSVTDTGLFDWSRYPHIYAGYRKGDAAQWGLTQMRKKGRRDMGATMDGEVAHRIATGAETLTLRLARSSATALALAQMLEQHPAVARVAYPMLPSHPQHARAQAWFTHGSWLLSFELRDSAKLVPVIDALRWPIKATGMGDTRTLIIPVAPTIFWEAGAQVRAAMGIADGLIRVSVGLEDAADLLADFAQALERA